jgi:hypothetical protein
MGQVPALWQDPRSTLTYEHGGDHQIVSFDDLRQYTTTADFATARNASEPYIVCRYAGWVQKKLQAEEMLEAFLAATSLDGLLDFTNRWSLPSLMEPLLAGDRVYAPVSQLWALQEQLELAASLLTAEAAGHPEARLRFEPDPKRRSRPAPQWLGQWTVLRALESLSGSSPDGKRPSTTRVWVETGVKERSTGKADDDARVPVEREAGARRTGAAAEISHLIEHHTRNTFQYVNGRPIAEVVRLSDPIGTLALVLTDVHTGGREVRRCALDTCRRLFTPRFRVDQLYCRKSHANAASNKRRRRSGDPQTPGTDSAPSGATLDDP